MRSAGGRNPPSSASSRCQAEYNLPIQFKRAPLELFKRVAVETLAANELVLRIQPQERIALRFGAKIPAAAMQVGDVDMDGWRIVTPVIDVWQSSRPTDFPNYTAGTWGPQAADDLLSRAGRVWRRPG